MSLLIQGDDFGYSINDEYILSGYSISRVKNPEDNDDKEELSDYVKLRLFLARELAMKKYYEKWG